MTDTERKMVKLGVGWCLKITDVPQNIEADNIKYMWACYLSKGPTYGGTATEGVDWFIAPSAEKVLDVAIETRKNIQRERKREAA